MKLIIEPDDGVAPLISAIKKARQSLEMVIFRLDRDDIEMALRAAAASGVKVTTLVASANRHGEESLRNLEMRLLECGIIVARSADDLVRYHDKLLIVDRRILYLLSFNCTHIDTDRSRGFGIVTKNARWVSEACRLFEADCTRILYRPAVDTFVVSPSNSRRVLSGFLRRAKRQLLIYDPKISDQEMIRILEERARAGIEIRIIGRIDESAHLSCRKLAGLQLHTRTIIRDGRQAFVGSQSLRPAELDARREAGLIVRDPKVVGGLIDTFESDWAAASMSTPACERTAERDLGVPNGETEMAVQVLVKELDPLTATVKEAVKKVVAEAGEEGLDDRTVRDTVKMVVKKAVKEAVKEATREVAEDTPKP